MFERSEEPARVIDWRVLDDAARAGLSAEDRESVAAFEREMEFQDWFTDTVGDPAVLVGAGEVLENGVDPVSGEPEDGLPAVDTDGLATRPVDAFLVQELSRADLSGMDEYQLIDILGCFRRVESVAAAGVREVAAELASRDVMVMPRPTVVGRHVAFRESVAADEIAPKVGCSKQEANRLVRVGGFLGGIAAPTGDALAQGLIDASKADVIAEAVSVLDAEKAYDVQAELLPKAAGWTRHRVAKEVASLVAKADPSLFNARAARASTRRYVGRARVDVDGMASHSVYWPAADALALDLLLDSAASSAKTAGDLRTLEQLRADILADIAAHGLSTGQIGDLTGFTFQLHTDHCAHQHSHDHHSSGSSAGDSGESRESGAAGAAVAGETETSTGTGPDTAPTSSPEGTDPTETGPGGDPDGTSAPETNDSHGSDGTTLPSPSSGDDSDGTSAPETGPTAGSEGTSVPDASPTAGPEGTSVPETGPADGSAQTSEPFIGSWHGADTGTEPRVFHHAPNRGLPRTWTFGVLGGRRAQILVRVPLNALMGGIEPGEIEGLGPIPADVLAAFLAGGDLRRLVTDPITGRVLDYGTDRYHPTQNMTDRIKENEPYCTAPGCSATSRMTELDHRIPFPEGPTSDTNLDPKCRRCHLLKTHGNFEDEVDQHGNRFWRTPTGHVYMRTPNGTITELRHTNPTNTGPSYRTLTDPNDEPPPF